MEVQDKAVVQADHVSGDSSNQERRPIGWAISPLRCCFFLSFYFFFISYLN